MKHRDAVAAYKRLRPELATELAAVNDFLSPPHITRVTCLLNRPNAGNVIRIRAEDDTWVERVRVRLYDYKYRLVERGKARRCRRHWSYRVLSELPPGCRVYLQVEAFDLPNHRSKVVGRLDV